MASVYRDSGSGRYYVRWREPDGRERKRAAGKDKAVAQRMARKIEDELYARRAGLVDPATERRAKEGKRPLDDHVAEFRRYLENRGATAKHARMTERFVRVVAELAGARQLADLAPAAVAEAIGTIRREGAPLTPEDEPGTKRGRRLKRKPASARTANSYLTGVKAFTRWAVKDGRLPADPLAHLEKFNEETDRRYVRQPFTAEELGELVRAAHRGPRIRKLSGPVRAMAYRLAAMTGFRVNELRSLTPRSFRLDSSPPVVACEAAFSKNRKFAEQPLPVHLIADLAAFLSGREPDERLFPLPLKTAAMIRADMAAAGISPVDEDGNVRDFHGLRGTYASLIQEGGGVDQDGAVPDAA